MKTHVHKFGGTSLGDASRIASAAQRIAADMTDGYRPVVVVSAMGGCTDALDGCIDAAASGESTALGRQVDALAERHDQAAAQLRAPDEVRATVSGLFDQLRTLLVAVTTLGRAEPRLRDRIMVAGEKFSARLTAAALGAIGVDARVLDADGFLETDDTYGEAEPLAGLYERTTRAAIEPLLAAGAVPIITGFCGHDSEGATTSLGRGGSDFTATLVAAALGAERVTIWTDVDGVYSADPRVVADARRIDHLHYREAGELAFYGAKVLHPRTLKPVAALGVPVTIRDSRAPERPGTRVDGTMTAGSHPVKALSAVRDHALLSLEGKGMAGVPGVAARLFTALARDAISVTMVSQSSAESSICIAVPRGQLERAEVAVRRAFRLDLAHGDIEDVTVQPNVGLVAAVGLGMAHSPGIAGRLLGAVGDAGVNLLAIAQGSSELNITLAVDGDDVDTALRAIHSAFGLHRIDTGIDDDDRFDVLLIGAGSVGRAFLRQLIARRDAVPGRVGHVVALADSSGWCFDPAGFDDVALNGILDAKAGGRRLHDLAGGRRGDSAALLEHALEHRLTRPVVVDCSDADTSALYLTAFRRGAAVVTANKGPLADDPERAREIRAASQSSGCRLRVEATVGAGLPVIDTLEMLLATGDRLRRAEGCLSGTLAFVLHRTQLGDSLSSAVQDAYARGYTEPDPYIDLSGGDVARKARILARWAGFELRDDQTSLAGLVPATLAGLDRDTLFARLKALDEPLEIQRAEAEADGKVLRHLATVTPTGIEVGLRAVPRASPLGGLQGTDNMIVFYTDRYADQPLVVQGPGAGVDVTAMGVLADVLRVAAERGAR